MRSLDLDSRACERNATTRVLFPCERDSRAERLESIKALCLNLLEFLSRLTFRHSETTRIGLATARTRGAVREEFPDPGGGQKLINRG